MRFPKKENLDFPEHIDSSPHVYRSMIMGPLYRKKLALLTDYLPELKTKRVLEIGFGSGIALPELSERSDEVCALDVHDHFTPVQNMLVKENLKNVRLYKHDIFAEPFRAEGDFDFVVASSVFEHIPENLIGRGLKNIYNCLNPDGYLLIGFPLKSRAMNTLFDLYERTIQKVRKGVYNFSHKDDHPSGEKEIIPQLIEFFTIEDRKYLMNRFLKLYIVLKCKKVA